MLLQITVNGDYKTQYGKTWDGEVTHTHLPGQAISVHPTIPSLQVLEERKEPMTCVQVEMQCVMYQVLQPSGAGKDVPFSYTMPSYKQPPKVVNKSTYCCTWVNYDA